MSKYDVMCKEVEKIVNNFIEENKDLFSTDEIAFIEMAFMACVDYGDAEQIAKTVRLGIKFLKDISEKAEKAFYELQMTFFNLPYPKEEEL